MTVMMIACIRMQCSWPFENMYCSFFLLTDRPSFDKNCTMSPFRGLLLLLMVYDVYVDDVHDIRDVCDDDVHDVYDDVYRKVGRQENEVKCLLREKLPQLLLANDNDDGDDDDDDDDDDDTNGDDEDDDDDDDAYDDGGYCH